MILHKKYKMKKKHLLYMDSLSLGSLGKFEHPVQQKKKGTNFFALAAIIIVAYYLVNKYSDN